MLEGMGRLHTKLQPAAKGKGDGAADSSIKHFASSRMSAALALPRLSTTIPREVTPTALASANATVARFLLQANAVRERDIPASWSDALVVCQGSLDAWVKREIGSLHCLAPCFVLRPVSASARAPFNSPPRRVEYIQVEVAWFQNNTEQWAVGGGLERLEAAYPRLGSTALHVLDWKSHLAYPLFTPAVMADVVSMLYWHGEEDEALALAEAGAEGDEERAALASEMVTKQDLTAAFPPWALAKHAEPLPTAMLARIADDSPDANVREIAASLAELAQLRIKDECRPDWDAEFVGFTAVLSWRQHDMTVRVYDDLVNWAQQGDCCDLVGQVFFDLTNPRAMTTWQRNMRNNFKAIRLIDGLIRRLSEQQ